MKLSAIILAAGESRRMGEPKALVQFGEHRFLETIINNFHDAGVDHRLVVLGHGAADIYESVKHLPAQFLENPRYSLGQFSSLQAGVNALPLETDGAFLALVDQPQISSGIISAIKGQFIANPQMIVIPTFNGRRGHPPILPRAVLQKIASAPETETAATIIRRHPEQTLEFEVDSESILWNINTKDEVEEVCKRLGL
jgi:CTP:molybdopterin cytidylyltransferase MocA